MHSIQLGSLVINDERVPKQLSKVRYRGSQGLHGLPGPPGNQYDNNYFYLPSKLTYI